MTGYQSKKDMAQDKLAQPAQEPVAWTLLLTEEHHGLVGKAGEKFIGAPDYYPRVNVYTTPPQRTWVEPTGNEWFEWWRVSKVANETEAEIDFADFLIIAQAVVAKLKEKNNG